MYLILTASKDAYITNKILNNTYRAKDANTGRAGTLDLFKLYNESDIDGEDNPIELSRVLLKFNLDTLQDLTGTSLDVTDSSFKCELKLYNILGPQATPSNFNLIINPLAQSFDEGVGRDVGGFADLDICNFVTASYSNGAANIWNTAGANAPGLLGSNDIDFVASGSLGSGVENLHVSQKFVDGTEDLNLDITKIISGTITGQIANNGIRLAFSGTEETDAKTRFVKRFGSRHSRNIFIRPELHVSFDDSIQDHHETFLFDVSGSLFLKNYHRGQAANLLSGSSLTPLVGQDCMRVTIRTGSYSKVLTASQHTGSTTGAGLTGFYSASFAIPSNDATVIDFNTTLAQMVTRTGSITFEEYWHTKDGSVGFYTGSLTIKSPFRNTSFNQRKPRVKITNLNSTYSLKDKVRFRVFGLEGQVSSNAPAKKARKTKREIFENVFYRVVDSDARKVVIPFSKGNRATVCSTDSDGMYFDFHMNALSLNRVYHFEFLVVDRGFEFKIDDPSTRFRVVN